ncbi:MAG: complex I subunit 5 family protein [Roseburia sp.]
MNNIPFITIILAMIGAVVSLLIGKRSKNAYLLSQIITLVIAILSLGLVGFFVQNGGVITYMLGHYPAPWGNELRFGLLESTLALIFSLVMFLAILGGRKGISEDVKEEKQKYYFSFMFLLLLSMLALIYTNDLFTAYVFIEINTLASCAIVMAKESGDTLKATIKYLVMSLLGSGLFLIAISLLYSVTGHLLIPSLQTAVSELTATNSYSWPLAAAAILMTVALGIKSAMFPFHTWLPDAHGTATTASSSILSGLVVKGYIILMIKIFYSIFGIETIRDMGILTIVFVLGIAGMLGGSVLAIRERNLKRMVAYSSVAQIGYIYMAIGMGTWATLAAGLFHMVVHAFTKPLLFTSAGGLIEVSGHSKQICDLSGAGYRNKWAGIGFLVGACSMVGIPLFGGFTSKVYLATSSLSISYIPIVALAISSCLNAMYYLPVLVRIFSKSSESSRKDGEMEVAGVGYGLSITCFIAINLALGMVGFALMYLLAHGVQLL